MAPRKGQVKTRTTPRKRRAKSSGISAVNLQADNAVAVSNDGGAVLANSIQKLAEKQDATIGLLQQTVDILSKNQNTGRASPLSLASDHDDGVLLIIQMSATLRCPLLTIIYL